MATLRELKGRIGSVKSSEKITGAMKMISSAKMHKAEGILRRLTPFKECVETIIRNLMSSDAPISSELTNPRQEVSRIAMVAFGSDDGLCGAYNVNVFKFLLSRIEALKSNYGENIEISVFPVGKKIRKILEAYSRKTGVIKVLETDGIDSKSEGNNVKEFGKELQKEFLSGLFDEVELIYIRYYSAGRQRPVSDGYLPVAADKLLSTKSSVRPYLFEPDAATVFSQVIPMYLLSELQEAFAHNRASEQAARVMAMQSANDNAGKLLEQLQLEYNKLRQQGITTELLDIVGGQVRD